MQDGKLALLGVVQEQHPERARLFAQWQQFDWPILHDPINVLRTKAVPIFVAIDEHGIVRSTRAKLDGLQEFLDSDFVASSSAEAASSTPSGDLKKLQRLAQQNNTAAGWRTLGDALALSAASPSEAIAAYDRALKLDSTDYQSQFSRGVVLRRRFESNSREPEDFSEAIAAWESALAGVPSQYIWRRRIQQYGPRLKKPYPFYDWVKTAQQAIRDRGEVPVALPIVPSGAEIASPSRKFQASRQETLEPDPQGGVDRDTQQLMQVELSTVPSVVEPGSTARVHVTFTPNRAKQAHWNNEAEPLLLWLQSKEGWGLSQRLLRSSQPAVAESQETRRLDFEIQVPKSARGEQQLRAYAVYYCCEDAGGTCLFLRQDVTIQVRVSR